MVVIIVEKRISFTRSEFGIVAAVALFLPLAVAITEELKIFNQKKQALENAQPPAMTIERPSQHLSPPRFPESETSPSTIPTLTTATTSTKNKNAAIACMADMFRPPDGGDDCTILQALVIILFFATICAIGGTLTAIDNMGQIGEWLGYLNLSISTFVSHNSIWKYAGRVAAGFALEMLVASTSLLPLIMLTK